MQLPRPIRALMLLCLALAMPAASSSSKQQQQQTPPRTQVVALSVGRSGTTVLTEMIASAAPSFKMTEPFKKFRVAELAHNLDASKQHAVPTVEQLLDCSVFEDESLRELAVPANRCEASPWLQHEPTTSDPCIRDAADYQHLEKSCKQASLVVIKVLRAPWVFSRQQKFDIPPSAKIIHLVRAPWSIVHSQLMAGWHSQTEWNQGYVGGSGILRFHLSRVCDETLTNLKIVEHHPIENLLTLRYEDLVTIFDDIYPSVLNFLGLEPSLEAIDAAVEAARGLYVATEGKRIMVDVNELVTVAETIPSCQRVMDLFSYN